MDVLAILLIVVPIVLPMLLMAGFDPIWLGIVLGINLEIALTTPPVGMNLFVLTGMAKPFGISYGEVVRGGLPYILCDVVALVVVIAFPAIALWLPGTMI